MVFYCIFSLIFIYIAYNLNQNISKQTALELIKRKSISEEAKFTEVVPIGKFDKLTTP